MKRLFAAIKIIPDDHFLKIYYRLLKQFEGERIKWVEPHNMHITLKFFGETAEERIADILPVIKKVSDAYHPFHFKLKGIGIFGSLYNPRLIWFGVENNDELKLVGNDLITRLDVAGFANDRQNFVPHLTVGRIRDLRHKRSFQSKIDQFKGLDIQNVHVDKICLFESKLTTSGPVYKEVAHFCCAKAL